MENKPAVQWLAAPQDHDYPAAAAYLSLTVEDAQVADIVARLKKAPETKQKAKDILRASRLALLPKGDAHVARDLAKVTKGEALSPILLVRGDLNSDHPLVIADGYHRVCVSYYVDVDTDIPCRIVPAVRPVKTTAKRATSAKPATSAKRTTTAKRAEGKKK